MDPELFRVQVRDALAHLYDRAYLETHALTAIVPPERLEELRGTGLQHILLDAIQALRPSPDVPYSSLAWRKYRYLYLRYAQVLPLPDIANDLGISLRQARRHGSDALIAVAALLWDLYGKDRATGSATDPDDEHRTVEQEVAHVEAEARETPVVVGELLVGVLETVRPLAERHGARLSVAISEGTPTAIIDRAVLRQVLLNVLTLSLEVGAEALELVAEGMTGDAEVRILVRALIDSDLAAAAQEILADDRWYIARHLLQAQRGQAALIPDANGALTIHLRIRSVPRRKVLVVEDNHDVITLYRRYLSDSPYQILATSEGRGAIDLATAEQPAIIVLDVMMPAQDGWEILQLLKSGPETRAIPVLICSILKERELALALGAVDLLVKPVDRSALVQALARHSRH